MKNFILARDFFSKVEKNWNSFIKELGALLMQQANRDSHITYKLFSAMISIQKPVKIK